VTQTESVLAALRSGHELTPLDALNRFGCFRLAARIDELRDAGYEIETRIVRNGRKAHASYYLRQPDLFAPSIPLGPAVTVPAGERGGAV
jgi:hypothetical protein